MCVLVVQETKPNVQRHRLPPAHHLHHHWIWLWQLIIHRRTRLHCVCSPGTPLSLCVPVPLHPPAEPLKNRCGISHYPLPQPRPAIPARRETASLASVNLPLSSTSSLAPSTATRPPVADTHTRKTTLASWLAGTRIGTTPMAPRRPVPVIPRLYIPKSSALVRHMLRSRFWLVGPGGWRREKSRDVSL